MLARNFFKILFYFVIHINFKVNFACLGDLGVLKKEFVMFSLAINMIFRHCRKNTLVQFHSIAAITTLEAEEPLRIHYIPISPLVFNVTIPEKRRT